jgi:diadenylate cyclase
MKPAIKWRQPGKDYFRSNSSTGIGVNCVPDFISSLIANLIFIFERLNWLSVLDLALVTVVFFTILMLIRDTQAMVLLRGAFFLLILISLLTSLDVLPAFSWLVQTTLPALVVAVPVIFAPEIRRALERLGRAGNSIVTAATRLSDLQYGALIVLQRHDVLEDYVRSGVYLNAQVTPELLLQVFYPNTPLHDGAVIISNDHLVAAACVMPLSSSGVLTDTTEHKMGLRHRAALGISEVSDAVAVVVSEETGSISVVHSGRMIRRLDGERLNNILRAFFHPPTTRGGILHILGDLFKRQGSHDQEINK